MTSWLNIGQGGRRTGRHPRLKRMMAIAASISTTHSKGLFIDELNEEHLTKWFADLNNRTSPGAANRTLEILKHMFNKAETWGYRLENTNPCRAVRANRRKHCERFLTKEELASLGDVLETMRTCKDSARRGAAAVIGSAAAYRLPLPRNHGPSVARR